MDDAAITMEVRFVLLCLFLQRLGVDRPGPILEVMNWVELDDELEQDRRLYPGN